MSEREDHVLKLFVFKLVTAAYIPARLLTQPRGFRYTIRVTVPSLLSQQEHTEPPHLLSRSPNTHYIHPACRSCQPLTCGHALPLQRSCGHLLSFSPSSALSQMSFLRSIYLFVHPSIGLFVGLSIYLFVHPSIHQPIYLFIHIWTAKMHKYIHPSIRPSIGLSICLSIHPSVYLSVCLSIHPSVYLSVCLSIHPSILQSIHR